MRFPTLLSAANAALLLDHSSHTQITVSFILHSAFGPTTLDFGMFQSFRYKKSDITIGFSGMNLVGNKCPMIPRKYFLTGFSSEKIGN